MVLGKLAGTVASGCKGEDISRIDRVVHSAIERHKIVFILIPPITRVDSLTWIQIRLIRYVEICDIPVCLVIILPRISGKDIELVYTPSLLIVGICLKDLTASDIITFIIMTDTQTACIGICLE